MTSLPASAARVEPLEPRRLLSASVVNRVLVVTGTDQNDTISIRLESGGYYVSDNEVRSRFDAADVDAVRVNSEAGNDRVLVDERFRGFDENILIAAQVTDVPPLISFTPFDITVSAGPGDDFVEGGSGNDTIMGDGGNDSLNGLFGNDVLAGGTGKDTLSGVYGDDAIGGGAGVDTVTYRWAGARYELSLDGVKNDFGYRDRISHTGKLIREVDELDNLGADIENVVGGSGNDTLKGNGGDNYLDGGTGGDVLNGGAGDDTINGNFGNDEMYGGGGSDTADYSDRAYRLNITLDDQRNDGQLETPYAAREKDNIHRDIEHAWGGRASDYIVGNELANDLRGGGGHDTLIGGDGEDTLVGGAGNDSINGGAGEDSLVGGSGDDAIVDTQTLP